MEQNEIRIVTVGASNVGEEGFFCYKSKKKADISRTRFAPYRRRRMRTTLSAG